MKIRTTFIVMVLALLAGCEAPVDAAKIRLIYGVPGSAAATQGGDLIRVYDPHDSGGVVTLRGEPGEQVTLSFVISNAVRDDVFVQSDTAAIYVSSVTTYTPRATVGQIEPVGTARSVDPAAPAATYRLLLRLPRSAREEQARGLRDESSFEVRLPVKLPAGKWEHAEITVVFYLHGFTRETRGEFRDGMTQTVLVERRPTTRPATTGAATSTAPASELPDTGTPSIMFVRPLTQPGTVPGTMPR